jgi:protein arginine kinase
MILEDFDYSSCGWLAQPGPRNDIVLSSRIRLARNVEGFPFSNWASTGEIARLVSTCSEVLRKTPTLKGSEELHLEEMEELNLQFLLERHQISQEMAGGQIQRSVFIHPTQTLGAMVAEEDHLRLQVFFPGLDLDRAWGAAKEMDRIVGESLPYSYSDRLGHLTACPTNVGTGLRCSVMVHLPALVMTRQIQRMINAISNLGMTVRGPQGEGSEIKGNLFQISNQITLGVSEQDLIDKLKNLAEQVVDSERKAAEQLMDEAREDIYDRAMRAYGILSYAHKLTSKETLELLSPLRLGITCGVVKNLKLDTVNELLLCSRPAHLQKRAGRPLDSRERDIYRAEFVRTRLSEATSS